MESKKAQKLITKILSDLNHAGIIVNTLIDDLKELRPYALEEKNPLAVKVLRLTYEHIEKEKTFNIAIPDDEPIDLEDQEEGQEVMAKEEEDHNPKESMSYLIALFKDLNNKMNVLDLKAYRDALNDY